MEFLTRAQAEAWCDDHDVALTPRNMPRLPVDPSKYDIPSDAGRRIAFTRKTMQAFQGVDNYLIWLDDWSVWPSGQWSYIFERYRLSYGFDSTLSDAPAHILREHEFIDGISLAVMATLFLWDCYVIGPQPGRFVYFSHDEFCLSAMG